MSLTNILKGIGRRILGGKKESATPATGQQTKQITYTPKPSQEQAKDLVTQELKNPPVVLKKTKPAFEISNVSINSESLVSTDGKNRDVSTIEISITRKNS